MDVVQIDIIDAQRSQVLCTSDLRIFGRAIDIVRRTVLDEAEFGRQEDLRAFACALEPFVEEGFIVAVETVGRIGLALPGIYVYVRTYSEVCIPERSPEFDSAVEEGKAFFIRGIEP